MCFCCWWFIGWKLKTYTNIVRCGAEESTLDYVSSRFCWTAAKYIINNRAHERIWIITGCAVNAVNRIPCLFHRYTNPLLTYRLNTRSCIMTPLHFHCSQNPPHSSHTKPIFGLWISNFAFIHSLFYSISSFMARTGIVLAAQTQLNLARPPVARCAMSSLNVQAPNFMSAVTRW